MASWFPSTVGLASGLQLRPPLCVASIAAPLLPALLAAEMKQAGDEPKLTLDDLVQVHGLTFSPWVNRDHKIVRNFRADQVTPLDRPLSIGGLVSDAADILRSRSQRTSPYLIDDLVVKFRRSAAGMAWRSRP